MREDMPRVVGNRLLKQKICTEIRNGTLSHAFILAGKPGSGRHTLAKEIAKALFCTSDGSVLPCGECLACRKIDGGFTDDVIPVYKEPGKSGLSVDGMRKVLADVSMAPTEFDGKVYIIDEADKMLAPAQNCFLRTLEEPPEGVRFLLICEDEGKLLPTIRSRAPILRMETLSDADLSEALRQRSPVAARLATESPDEFREIVRLSDGNLGRALDLTRPQNRQGEESERSAVLDAVRALLAGRSAETTVNTLGGFSSKRDEYAVELDLLSLALRDLLVLKKSDDVPLCFFTDRDEAMALSDSVPLRRILRLLSAVEDAAEANAANINIRISPVAMGIDAGLL